MLVFSSMLQQSIYVDKMQDQMQKQKSGSSLTYGIEVSRDKHLSLVVGCFSIFSSFAQYGKN